MADPSEQEKYSIDDMMDRLKNRPDEDPIENGEFVTRADGTRAIRVRKRKRRSHQPHKEEAKQTRRARMVQVSAALILLLLFLFGAGAAIVFANSAPFREGLIEKISRSSGASVELEQFRMNPTSANAGRLILSWPEHSVLEKLTLRNIRAKISPSAFFGNSMTGEGASAAEGTLTLRIPNPDAPKPPASSTEDARPIRFKSYSSPKLQILLGNATAPLARLNDTEASFTESNVKGHAQLLLNRGDVRIHGWPKLRMDRSHIEFRNQQVDLIGMRFKHPSDTRGSFELGGSIAPYSTDPSTLAAHLDSFPLSGIAGEDLGKLFSGTIDTNPAAQSNYLTFSTHPKPESSLVLSFRSSLPTFFELNGFPFLFGLAQTLDDDWFSHPTFDSEATGTIRRIGGSISLSDLNLRNKGRMAIHGSVTMQANQRLSGNLEVGIADAMVNPLRNRRVNSLLSPSKNGFRWVSLTIDGSAKSPGDNFKDLYNAAKSSPSPSSKDRIPSFEELTTPE